MLLSCFIFFKQKTPSEKSSSAGLSSFRLSSPLGRIETKRIEIFRS